MFGFNRKPLPKPEKDLITYQKRLEALSEINNALVGQLDRDRILSIITGKLVSVIDASFASVWIWDEKTRTLALQGTTVPKAVEVISERAMGGPIYKVATYHVDNPEHQKNHYVESFLKGEFLITDSLYNMSYPLVDKRTAGLLQTLLRMKIHIAVPLLVRDQKIGVLGIMWKNKVVTEEDKTIIYTFANQITTAIYNAQLFQQVQSQVTQLESQNRDLSSLFNLTSRIGQTLDTKLVAQEAVDSLPQDKEMLGGIISLLDKTGNKLETKAVSRNALSENIRKVIGDFSQYFTDLSVHTDSMDNQVITTQHPIFTDKIDVWLQTAMPAPFISAIQRIIGLNTLALYPLVIRGSVLGTVAYFLKGVTPENVSTSQKQLFQTFTNQIAIALENASLFEQSQQSQKNLERALSELQESRRRERDMIDIMGHELRTPMSIVRNALSMMDMQLRTKGEIPADKQKKYTEIGLESARRESKLIETLLSATKADAKGFQLTFEKVDLIDVINDSLVGFKIEAAKKGLELIFEKPSEQVFVFCDRTRVQEIADNFISNAIKYTPKGFVKIYMEQKDGFVWTTIEDSGFGISPEDIQHLGKKFYRAKQHLDENTKNIEVIRPGGTGLGLYVSFALAKIMDGDYKVESTVGKGSKFMFSVPLYTNQKLKQEDRKVQDYLDQTSAIDEPEVEVSGVVG